MRVVVWGTALVAVVLSSLMTWGSGGTAHADGIEPPAYDISWPQCPTNIPAGDFSFAVIGLNNGRPFTTNDCFMTQYSWAKTVEPAPAVYINLDFPKAENKNALTGPYGRCLETDDWCRAYNYGFASARDSLARSHYFNVSPEMFWLDVELDNHWSESPRNNAQVVRGALDYFLDLGINVGIYGTRYQWGLITGGFKAPGVIPLWVAGAEDRAGAHARCGDASFMFAGGETWLVQYPEGPYDGNVSCRTAATSQTPKAAAGATESVQSSSRAEASPLVKDVAPRDWTSWEIKRVFHN